MKAGWFAIAAVFLAGLGLALGGMPRKYEVVGISMAPGLLPGDVVATAWLPLADRTRRPDRWECWVARLPDGSTGIKRVVGLPGETISIDEGDLAIDGVVVLKQPRTLTEQGSIVSLSIPVASPTSWSWLPTRVLDEAPFAPDEASRRMLPVRDVGFAAIVQVRGTATARARARCGPLTITWRLSGKGYYGLVAGRLDGRAVAVAWPMTAATWPPRSCLAAGCTDHWDAANPWPGGSGDPSEGLSPEGLSPALGLELINTADARPAEIRQVAVWRDVLYHPAADGTTRWSLDTHEVFLLGDFPAASRDSRHFGPLGSTNFLHYLDRRPRTLPGSIVSRTHAL